MSYQLFLSAILVIAVLMATVLVAVLVVLLKDRKPRRKSRRRKSSFWKNARRTSGAVAKTLWTGIRKIAGAGWFVLSRLPGWIGIVLKWIASKLATLIRLLFVLAIYGIALSLALTALNIGVHTQYAGLVFVEFVKWGLIVIAAVIALAATIPLFGIVRRLVN